jgi:hypothetical protein
MPFTAFTGTPPLTEEPREWGGPFDATGLMAMAMAMDVGHVGAACRGKYRGGRFVSD